MSRFLAPVPIAWIAIGVEIDQSFAQEFRQESTLPLEVTFTTEQGDAGWVASVSTLSQVARAELPAALVSQGDVLIGETRTLTLGASDYVTLVASLPTPEDSAAVNAVLQYSLDLALVPYQPLFFVLTVLAAIAVVVSLVGSVAIARGVAKPIRTLDEAARRIQEGRYTDKVTVTQSDEIGRLGDTFNQMMEGIAEREARIEHQSLHDTATGLPNRRYFERELDHHIVESGAGAPVLGCGGGSVAFAPGLNPTPITAFPVPRSSNRTCATNASGFRTRSCCRPRKALGRWLQILEPVVVTEPCVREAHDFPRLRIVLPTEPLVPPLGRVPVDRLVGRVDLPEVEVVRPSGHRPV